MARREYRKLSTTEKELIRLDVMVMHQQGISQGQIAKILSSKYNVKLHKSQVNRIIIGEFAKEKENQQKRFENIYSLLPPDLKLLIKTTKITKSRKFNKHPRKILRRNLTIPRKKKSKKNL